MIFYIVDMVERINIVVLAFAVICSLGSVASVLALVEDKESPRKYIVGFSTASVLLWIFWVFLPSPNAVRRTGGLMPAKEHPNRGGCKHIIWVSEEEKESLSK